MRAILIFLVAVLSACGETEERTQLTVVLQADDLALRSRIARIDVSVRSMRNEGDPRRLTELRGWPVEIIIVPEGSNDTNRVVTFEATAYDGSNQRVGTWGPQQLQFASRMLRRTTLAIGPASVTPSPDGGVDAGADAGVDAAQSPRDANTPIDAAPPADGRMPEMEASVEVDASADATPGKPNCMTPGANIECNDRNPCNGMEVCDPTNASAGENGCVQGTDKQCPMGSTCDRMTGECSTCLVKPDGDGDGVASIECAGMDCDDRDDTVAPGKPEICDGQDNDCNGSVDGAPASALCVPPVGGTSSCEMSRCVPRCSDGRQLENDRCVMPLGTCPIINPCAPGSCVPSRGGYSCDCPAGYRAGLARCSASGLRRTTIGFDQTCNGMPTPSSFVMGVKTVPSTLYMSCGIAFLSATGLSGRVQLFEPVAMTLEGATGPVLEGTPAAMGTPSEITISFSPGANEVAFDVLDVDNNSGVRALIEAADGLDLLDMIFTPGPMSKRVRVTHTSVTPVARISVSYRPAGPEDRWFLEDLTFDLWGCGDGERETGEVCDDGNTVQCDGCDNACEASPAACLL